MGALFGSVCALRVVMALLFHTIYIVVVLLSDYFDISFAIHERVLILMIWYEFLMWFGFTLVSFIYLFRVTRQIYRYNEV